MDTLSGIFHLQAHETTVPEPGELKNFNFSEIEKIKPTSQICTCVSLSSRRPVLITLCIKKGINELLYTFYQLCEQITQIPRSTETGKKQNNLLEIILMNVNYFQKQQKSNTYLNNCLLR